jgi:hypothetical protein
VREFIGAQVKEALGPSIKVIQSSSIKYYADYLLEKTIKEIQNTKCMLKEKLYFRL